jgi:FeS assembly SUF system protein
MAKDEGIIPEPAPEGLKQQVLQVLKSCYDPEIPVNIYDLGLIYELEVDAGGRVNILMTLTAPSCPVAGAIPEVVRSRVSQIDGVKEVNVALTWDPPWSPDRMSAAARLQLGLPAM